MDSKPKTINMNAKKNKETLDQLQTHIEEHKDDMKHAILITYGDDDEITVTSSDMTDVEYFGMLELVKHIPVEFEE